MIKDRGNIKWTAMMLPEHVEMLRELNRSNQYKTKPMLDEQLLEEMNETICRAIEARQAVEITYFKNHQYECKTGLIDRFDVIEQRLRFVTSAGARQQIVLENIIDIKIVD